MAGPEQPKNLDQAPGRQAADTRHLVKASFLVSGFDLAGRLLGIVRESASAAIFGATRGMDAFVIAKSIPDMFSSWIEGPVRAAFVPLFTRRLHAESEAEAWKAASNIINCLAVVLVALTAILFLGSGALVRAFSTGFRSPEVWQESAHLTQVLVVSIVFSVIAVILSSLQNIYRRQLFPALGRLVSSGFVLGGVIVLGPRLGLMGYAWGILTGLIALFALQLGLVFRHWRQYRWTLNFRAPEVREVVLVAFPLVIGLTGTRIDVLLDRNFASFMPAGHLSVLVYATSLSAVFADQVMTVAQAVLLPHFAQLVAEQRLAELRQRLAQTLGGYFLFMMPVTAVFCVASRPIVNLVFQRGQFTAEDAWLTALVLPILAVGAPAHGAGQILAQVFISGGDTRTPMFVGFWRLGFKALLSAGLIAALIGFGYGVLGLAFASAASSFFRFYLLWRKLPRDKRPEAQPFRRMLGRQALAGLFGAAAGLAALSFLPPLGADFLAQALRAGLAALLIFPAHWWAAWKLGDPTTLEVGRRLGRALVRRRGAKG